MKSKKNKYNQWKLKMLMLSMNELFETSGDNYNTVWQTRKRLQSQINWRWEIIHVNGLIQVKRIENYEPISKVANKPDDICRAK